MRNLVCALLFLHQTGHLFRVGPDGAPLCRAPQNPPPDATQARALLRTHPAELVALLAWPVASWEAVARFGHADAVLYPYLGGEVQTAAGPARLLRVLSGRAEVHRPGEARTEIIPAAEIRPPQGGAARAV